MTSDLTIEVDQPDAFSDGLDAATVEFVFADDDAEFNRHVDIWFDRLRPATPEEAELVRNTASISWELELTGRHEKARRAERIEAAVQACGNGGREQIERARALASFDPSLEGERLRRYKLALHRESRRDLESLAKLKHQSEKRAVATRGGGSSDEEGSRESGVGSREEEGGRDSLARRGAPDPAGTPDRRSPEPGQGADAPRSPELSAPRSPELSAPRSPVSDPCLSSQMTPVETASVPPPLPHPRGSGRKCRATPKRLFKEHRAAMRSKADAQSEQARLQRRMMTLRAMEASREADRGWIDLSLS
jgi:hypothetical protein